MGSGEKEALPRWSSLYSLLFSAPLKHIGPSNPKLSESFQCLIQSWLGQNSTSPPILRVEMWKLVGRWQRLTQQAPELERGCRKLLWLPYRGRAKQWQHVLLV